VTPEGDIIEPQIRPLLDVCVSVSSLRAPDGAWGTDFSGNDMAWDKMGRYDATIFEQHRSIKGEIVRKLSCRARTVRYRFVAGPPLDEFKYEARGFQAPRPSSAMGLSL